MGHVIGIAKFKKHIVFLRQKSPNHQKRLNKLFLLVLSSFFKKKPVARLGETGLEKTGETAWTVFYRGSSHPNKLDMKFDARRLKSGAWR